MPQQEKSTFYVPEEQLISIVEGMKYGDEAALRIRSITFKFPIPTCDGEVKEFPLESWTTIESVVTLIRNGN